MFYECGTDKYSRIRTTSARNAKGLQTDPVLWDYEDCLSDNLVSYQTKYILFGSWSLSSSSSTIFQEKFHLHFLYQHK